MPLNLTAAHSSRVTKRQPQLKRSASSPFINFGERKPIQRSKSNVEAADNEDDFAGGRLDDIGIVRSLPSDPSLRDVAQIIKHVRFHMFDPMPQNGGFHSTRIAEILNLRKSLPPMVTCSHIYALTLSPTKTEREIAELIRAGIIRRLVTPGRGTGGSSIGESLVISTDVGGLLEQAPELDQELSGTFILFCRTGTDSNRQC